MSEPGSATPAAGSATSSFGQIFRSTAFIGGASAINLVLGIVRTKVMAVLLGPAGIGAAGIFTTIQGFASTLAGMGIGNSGVREIAEAAGSGDDARIGRTVRTLRRTALVLGIAGAAILALASFPLATLTFGDSHYAPAIALLSLAVLFGAISGGQVAMIQGLRRIGDLARINVLGALIGTVLGLPLLWWLGDRGIVPMLVVVAGGTLVCSWWAARKVPIPTTIISWRESAAESRSLLGLGFAFMASALMLAGVAYLIRLLIVRQLGLEAAGHYAAAYTLAGIYAGFLLQAMGADFYPRLTAVASDHPSVNRLVNEQTEIALLLSVPGALATLVFAPQVIHIFYSGRFDAASAVLEWQVLGILGRVISWPLGFILLAKGERTAFLWTEIASNAAHLAFVWVGIRAFGLKGTGMAFAALYFFYCVMLLIVASRLTGFTWSSVNLRLLLLLLPIVGGAFAALHWLPTPTREIAGAVATLVAGVICFKGVLRRMPAARLARFPLLARWA